MDKEIQSRSGLNIGIESSLLPFVQAAAAEVIVIPATGAEVVLVEHTDQAARVPMVCGAFNDTPDNGPGYVWSTDPALPAGTVQFSFVDELGNKIQIAATGTLDPTIPNEIESDTLENGSFFCLAKGEKIVASFVPNGR